MRNTYAAVRFEVRQLRGRDFLLVSSRFALDRASFRPRFEVRGGGERRRSGGERSRGEFPLPFQTTDDLSRTIEDSRMESSCDIGFGFSNSYQSQEISGTLTSVSIPIVVSL